MYLPIRIMYYNVTTHFPIIALFRVKSLQFSESLTRHEASKNGGFDEIAAITIYYSVFFSDRPNCNLGSIEVR